MWTRLLVAILFLSVPLDARPDDLHHTLWAVKGAHNTVYLLGSIHILKQSDSALPPEAMRAYANAKAVVMELDPARARDQMLLKPILDLETLPTGQTLANALGPEIYGKFKARAIVLGVDPEFTTHFQPWFAALMLDQIELATLGFDPDAGVEMQLVKRTQEDHKDIIGLETLEDQLGVFAQLSPDEQRHFVLYMLTNDDKALRQMDSLVSAWQHGDTKTLEKLLGEGFEEFPDLFKTLTTDRNRAWLPKITALLNDDRDYLVVVGALHLVGNSGVVELLKRQGYEVVQH